MVQIITRNHDAIRRILARWLSVSLLLTFFVLLTGVWYPDQLCAQNVGIGTTEPLGNLHVLGDIRSDSLVLGAAGSTPVVSIEIADVSYLAHNLYSIGSLSSGLTPAWQSFTAESMDTLGFIAVLSTGPVSADTLRIYEGMGIEGTLLATVLMPDGEGWVQSAALNIPVSEGSVYTFWIDDCKNLNASIDTYEGGSLSVDGTVFPTVDLTFAACSSGGSVSQPFSLLGHASPEGQVAPPLAGVNVDIDGLLNVDYLRLRGGATDGAVLGSDANGMISLKKTWKENAGTVVTTDTQAYVGIGTHDPFAKLHLAGADAQFRIDQYSGGNNIPALFVFAEGTSYFQDSDETRLAISEDGVSIGAINPFSDSQLSVYGRATMHTLRITTGAGPNRVLRSDDFGNASWTPDHWLAEGLHLHYNGGGNVGIGTNAPTHKLHIHRNDPSPGGNSLLLLENSGTGGAGLRLKRAGLMQAWDVYVENNDILSISRNGPPYLGITPDGNIGIGNTTPTSKLDVTGKITAEELRVTSGAMPGFLLTSDAQGNATWTSKDQAGYWSYSNGHIFLNQGGNLGVGTPVPYAKLQVTKDVTGNGANDFLLLQNLSQGGVGISYYNLTVDFSSRWQSFVEADGKYKIGRAGVADYLTITPTGDIGIGTSDPSTKLDVQGNMGVQGNMDIGGDINIDGSISIKYSGTVVFYTDTSLGLHTYVTTLPDTLPPDWTFLNTVVLISVSDGLPVMTIHQAKLISTTELQVQATLLSGTGLPIRFNYIILKL